MDELHRKLSGGSGSKDDLFSHFTNETDVSEMSKEIMCSTTLD